MRRIVLVLSLCVRPSVAVAVPQESLPVTVDASPTAHEQLERARELALRNPTEAARLVQEVLDAPGDKLVPWPSVPDRYRPAAAAAEELLRTQPALRQAWLRVQAPIAQRQLEQGDWMAVVRRRVQTPAGIEACLQLAQQAIDGGRLPEADAWLERALRHPDVGDERAVTLQRVRKGLDAIHRPHALTATRTDTVRGEPAVFEAIWSQSLASVPSSAGPGRTAAGTWPSASTRFDVDELLWSDGTMVRSFDRFSGSQVWEHALVRPPAGSAAMPGEPASLAWGGDRVVVLPGLAGSDGRTVPSSVVALDRASGRPAWQAAMERLVEPALQELFPHGDVVVAGDAVVVQARRSSQQLETAAWLLAFDLRDGSLRWSRPIGAAGGVRLSMSRPLSSPTMLGSDVIAGSSLGVVARVGSALGELRWLRTWPAPLREPASVPVPWQLPSPVTDGRIVAWLAPDGETLVLMRAEDGATLQMIQTGPGTDLGTVRTLEFVGPTLLAVGDDVAAVSTDAPDRAVWKLSSIEPESLGTLRGRVTPGTLSDGTLVAVIPLEAGVRIVDPGTGSIVGRWNIAGGGQPALQQGQLALAGDRRLSVAMPAREGERLLRDRLAEMPTDPRRGMALLELGLASSQPELVIEGARAVQVAMERPEGQGSITVRQEVVQRLTASDLVDGLAEREARQLLEIAGEIARSTPERLSVVLATAELDARSGRPDEALAAWWSVWADPAMRLERLAPENGRVVAAGPHALARGAIAGPDIRRQLARRLSAAAESESDPLERLRHLRALCSLQGVDTLPPDPSPSQPDWLLRVLAALPGGKAEPVPGVLPLGTSALSLPGSLVPEGPQARLERPLDSVLLRDGAELVLRAGPELAERWRAAGADRNGLVAAWQPSLVLWSSRGADDGTLFALDPVTGQERGRVASVQSILPAPQAMRTQVDCLRCGENLLLLRADGAMACLAIENLQPRWSEPGEGLTLCADASDWSVVTVQPGDPEWPARVALRRADSGELWLSGVVPEAIGEPRWVRITSHGIVVAGPQGIAMLELAPGLPSRWQRTDPALAGAECKGDWAPWLLLGDRRDRLVGLDLETGTLQRDFLSLPDGRSRLGSVVDVWPLHDGLLVRRVDRLSLHARDGAIRGIDATAREPQFDLIAPVRNGLVVAELERSRRAMGLDPEGRVAAGNTVLLRTMEPSQGLRSSAASIRVDVGSLVIQDIDAIEGWILLGSDQGTVAVSAADPSAPAPR
jgi:outer membrane protein assembly factor BamB